MTLTPEQHLALKQYYEKTASERDAFAISDWKQAQRRNFLTHLQTSNARTLVELGSGPGQDALFFKQHGLNVTCVDFSAEMLNLCKAKGLTTLQCDLRDLPFEDASFDAAYSMNAFLHLPKSDLAHVLGRVQRALKPDALFYLGLSGGEDFEGMRHTSNANEARFFSFHTDEHLKRSVQAFFEILSFNRVPVTPDGEYHFQALILKNTR